MLSPVDSSVSTYFFNRFLEDSCRIFQSNLIKRRQDIWISKMLLTFDFNWCRIFYLRIYTSFGCIVYPLSNKYFIFFRKKVRALPLSFVIYPVSFEMITTTLGHDSITTPFSHIPHTLVNISIWIYHSSLAMWKIIHPHSIESIATFIEHSSSSLLRVALPITSVLSS